MGAVPSVKPAFTTPGPAPAVPPRPVNARAHVEYDFYRCSGTSGCGRLITRLELIKWLVEGHGCKCGSLSFSPRNPRFYHFLLPRVVKFAYERLRRRA